MSQRIPKSFTAQQLQKLYRTESEGAGERILDAAQEQLLRDIAAHPNLDAFTRDDINRRLSTEALPPLATQRQARPPSTSLSARTMEVQSFFGWPAPELGSISGSLVPDALHDLLQRQLPRIIDGRSLTRGELSWCHQLACHKNASVLLRSELADAIENCSPSKGLDATFALFLDGLRGQVPLPQWHSPLPSAENTPRPPSLNRTSLPLPDGHLNATSLGFAVEEMLSDAAGDWPDVWQIDGNVAAWLIDVSMMPNADLGLRTKIGHIIGQYGVVPEHKKEVRDVATALLGGAKFDMLSPNSAGSVAEETLATESLLHAIRWVHEVLVEAAGVDARLTPAEANAALQPLTTDETNAVRTIYEEITSRAGEVPISVADLRKLFHAETRALSKDSREQLPLSAIAQSSIFAAVSVDFARVIDEHDKKLDDGLRHELRHAAAPRLVFSYRKAREKLFSEIDNNRGSVEDIYTGREVALSHLDEADGQSLTTEHARPQSTNIEGTSGVSDLHHLFIADARANTKRSNNPFGIVTGDPIWEDGKSKLGRNAQGHVVYEPPPEHRGNIARALFYCAIVYDLRIEETEEATLRRWHIEDPVDPTEMKRNEAIEAYQGNRNPFVDSPGLVGKLSNF